MPDESELVAAAARFPTMSIVENCAVLRESIEIIDGTYFVRITPSYFALLDDVRAYEVEILRARRNARRSSAN